MIKKINIKKISVFIISALLVLFITTGVQAATGEIDNQLTVLYKTEDHNFSELMVDQDKVNFIENVSDLVDVIHFKDSDDAAEMIETIKANENVLAVDYEAIAEVKNAPNDKFYKTRQGYLKDMGFENVVAGNETVKVAVVDTGVDPTHEDLVGRVEESGYNYISDNTDTLDLEGHGTFIAGLISAQTNNGIGIAGASGQANVFIVPYVCLGSDGEGELSGIAAALEDIAKRDDIKIVNLSLGFDNDNEVLNATCQKLADSGKILVVSSGNYDDDFLMYPARFESTISVGAVNNDNVRCSEEDWGEGFGSNYGEGLDIVAPGDDVASTDRGNIYILGAGTSYSAPFVSAACALAATRDATIDLAAVRAAISSTSKDLGASGWDPEYGYGLLQLDSFVNHFNTATYPTAPVVKGIKISGEKTLDVKANDEIKLEANVETNGIINSYPEWKSSDEHVATVDGNGNVVAVGVGECTITAQIDGYEDTVHVNVTLNDASQRQPVYRLYNKTNSEHLYTTDINEVKVLSSSDWIDEGTGWNSPLTGEGVYRLYGITSQEHLYTKDKNEMLALAASGDWKVDNNGQPLFYSGGEKPIYRLYNEELKRHHLTTDLNEYETLGLQGWTKEGVALESLV